MRHRSAASISIGFAGAVALAGCAHVSGPAATPSASAATRRAFALIERIDRAGPTLNSVVAVDPDAPAAARALDRERRAGRIRGPLHGVPIILKDNIEAKGSLPTTAGSLALLDNVTNRDAPLVRRLRDAGAVIIGKANLSEWANYRSTRSISGWSGVGGLTRNPFALDRSACGSSSGTAVAVAAGIAVAGIGTETDGSIICPASMNGIVGFKPTLGLVSRRHIVPITPEQDTAGPMARSVTEVANVLTAIAGSDAEDAATNEADAHRVDYAATLHADALDGVRVGVLRGVVAPSPGAAAVYERALATLASAGAVLVEVPSLGPEHQAQLATAQGDATRAEFRVAIDAYLAAAAPAVKTRSLAALIEFNRTTARETVLFGQELFEAAARAPSLGDPAYRLQRATARRLAGPEGLDRMMQTANVEVLVAPTSSPATLVDPVNRVPFLGSPSSLPAVAGYPHLTVPMGDVDGLPIGLSFIGSRWSDARILAFGFAFERRAHAYEVPMFPASISQRPGIADAYAHR